MTATERYLPPVGRILIVALFLISGFGKLAAPAATKAFIASSGLPMPDIAYLIAVICEIGGSIAFVLGYKTRIVAVIMAVFTLGAAIGFHTNFANQDMLIHFWKNISIIGGFLQVAAFGGGAISLDAYSSRSRLVGAKT